MSSNDAGPSGTRTTNAEEVHITSIDRGGMDTNELVTARTQRPQSEWSEKRATSSVTSVEESEDEGSDDEEESHQEPAPVAWNRIPAPSDAMQGTRFGLKKDKTRKKKEEANDPLSATFDYTKKYPRDKRYEELHDDARVWRTYNDEAAIFDTEMVGEAADSLDILLVFAGLFSAVLTTFVAQTSQSLSTDNAAVTNLLLVELIAVQRASSAGGSLSDIAPADIAPAIARTDVWVNALWFTSLALSLASALLAVLSKQWIRQYVSFIKGSARERALIRQFRYNGMEKWAVRTIIGLLPMILHVALALFLAGLVIFLAPLQRGIAASVGIISGVLFVAYAASIIIAVVHVESPYRTTFSDILSTTLRWMFTAAYPFFEDKLALGKIEIAPTARAAEQALAVCLDEDLGATQACDALHWLHSTTGSMSAKMLIRNSLGAFPAFFFYEDAQQAIFVQLSNGCGPDFDSVWDWRDNFPEKTADDSEMMLRILCHSNSAGQLFIDVNNVRFRDHLESDTGLALAYAALDLFIIRHPLGRAGICTSPKQTNKHKSPDEGGDAKLAVLQTLFSTDAFGILILSRLLPNNYLSYSSILDSLGSSSPLVWSHLATGSWFTELSPRSLDDWPHEVDLREYLRLVHSTQRQLQPVYSPSVFQNPVTLLSFLQNCFRNRGWQNLGAFMGFQKSVTPIIKDFGNLNKDDEDDEDLIGDSPPPDKDAVREAAVYPTEWPPLPAPTWAQAWEDAEAEWKAGRKAEEEEARRQAEEAKARRERDAGRGNQIRQFVPAKLRGGGKRARNTDIEMQDM